MASSFDKRLEAAFTEALEQKTETAREQYLSTLSQKDAALAKRVKELLVLQFRLDDILEAAPGAAFGSLLDTLSDGSGVTESDLASLLSQLQPSTEKNGLGIIGNYLLSECVAFGHTGFLFRGSDQQLNRQVALKVFPPSVCQDEKRRIEFLNEARIASSIRHENVVTVHHVSTVTDPPIVIHVMEWIEGETLQMWADRNPDPAPEQVVKVLQQISNGLTAIHAVGIVHRDLKPNNILIEAETGRVVIVDFGLAFESHVDLETDHMAGTPLYMAPEQLQGEQATKLSDQFSLGAIAFLLIYHRHPFAGDTLQDVTNCILEGRLSFPDESGNLSPNVRTVLACSLSLDPNHRYESVDEFCLKLCEALLPPGTKGPLSESPSLTDSAQASPGPAVAEQTANNQSVSSSRRLLSGWGVLLFLLAAIFLIFYLRRNQSEPENAPSIVAHGMIDKDTYINYRGISFRRIPSPPKGMDWPPFPDQPQLTESVDWRNIEHDAFIGIYEVTRDQYLSVMGELPDVPVLIHVDGTYPITNISLEDVEAFCQKLSEDDPESLRYGVAGEAIYAYVGFGYDALSQAASLEQIEQSVLQPGSKIIAVGETSQTPGGLKGVYGNVWEWTSTIARKKPLWTGVVSYEDFGELPSEASYQLFGGGARDLFIHAYDMNSGMNDFLEVFENTRAHTEPDGVTKYLCPETIGQPVRLVYRYPFSSPVKTAALQLSVHRHVENSSYRVRVQPWFDSESGNSLDWITVYEASGKNYSLERIDLSQQLKGASGVRIEHVMLANELPAHYTQFARTSTHSKKRCCFEASLESITLTLRKSTIAPRSFRSPYLGFRLSIAPETPPQNRPIPTIP